MSNEKTNLVRYVVITSTYYWGKGKTLEEALKNAHVNGIYALNSKKENTNKARVYRVELDPVKSVYDEKSAKAISSSGMTLEGYSEGDLIEPWVYDIGTLGTWGAKTEKVIDLKIK